MKEFSRESLLGLINDAVELTDDIDNDTGDCDVVACSDALAEIAHKLHSFSNHLLRNYVLPECIADAVRK